MPPEEKVGLYIFLIFVIWDVHALEPLFVNVPLRAAEVARPQPIESGDDQDLSVKLLTAPNFTAASGANRPRFFQVRGLGETSQFEHANVNAFGIFFEGIDLSEEASVLPRVTRETMHLAYGPQTTDWGGKALAGALAVKSSLGRPSPGSFARAHFGNYATYGLDAGLTATQSSSSWLAGVGWSRSDGFYHNQYTNSPTADRNEGEVVLGGSYKLGQLKVRQHHLWLQHRNGYDHWTFQPSFKTLSDHPGRDNHSVHGHSIQLSRQWQGLHLSSLSSVTLTQQRESYDEDWANNPYWNRIPAWNQDYNYYAQFDRHRLKLHQKLALTTAHDLEVGLHYFYYNEAQTIRSFQDESLRKTIRPDYGSQNLGLWTKKTWTFQPFKFGLGGRIEQQKIALSGVGPAQTQMVAPQWSLDARVTRPLQPGGILELLFSRGFRGGGYNTNPDLNRSLLSFGPEQLHLAQLSYSHEVERLSYALTGFHQWHEHQQSRRSVQFDPTDPNTFTYFTSNSGRSRSWGTESSVGYSINKLTLSGNLGLLQSRYGPVRMGNSNLHKRELAQAPTWNYTTRLEFKPKPWSAYLQLSGRDSYYHSAEHNFKSTPYELLDVGGSYSWNSWKVQLWIKNLLDRRYQVRSYYFANEPPAWREKQYVQLGDPRTFGAELTYNF